MKNILFIAYEFPPLNVGGSARPARFVKHLNKFGFNPIVLTLAPKDYNNVYTQSKIDSNLIDNLEERLEIVHVSSKNLVNRRKNRLQRSIDLYFNLHKEDFFWKEDFNSKVEQIICSKKISAVFVTAPPFSILTLAKHTSKKYGLPLIVDMRDPWTMWTVSPYSNYLNYLRVKFKEREIFKQADKIISTSLVTLDDFKLLHPKINSNKFVYIPNGFEFNIDFKTIKSTVKEIIKIGYVGSFYYSPENRNLIFQKWYKKKGHRKFQYVPRREDWLYRSPYFFFKTLRELFRINPKLEHRVEIYFVGNKPSWFDGMVEEFGLQKQVSHLGWMTQSDALKFQESCDFLLITSAKVEDGRDYSIAGKTFEYFKIQKPILSFVADGAQKDLLRQANLAHFVDVDNLAKGTEQLNQIFTQTLFFEPNESFINSFRIESLTKTLSNILNEVILRKQ